MPSIHLSGIFPPIPTPFENGPEEKISWDMLFFCGHSESQNGTLNGRIFINATESLTVSQLQHALKKAISLGLKLAFFNSCDGLGIARKLSTLHIPQIIVMREPVPDLVAQEFLKNFLKAFSANHSTYLAMREAREKLEKLESRIYF